jgi:hypothetical protein
MFEYQINVAIDGKFYFRTDWSVDKKVTHEIALGFIDRYGIDSVSVKRRSLLSERAEGFEQLSAMLD